ncbi:MAG: hypothetical protein ABIR32_22445 [Ilumatobacteraceae bacterium]
MTNVTLPATDMWNRDARVAVIVLAKIPVAGRVKTRCTPPCTPSQAADLAAASLSGQEVDELTDVDDFATAVEVADLIPQSHFARVVTSTRASGDRPTAVDGSTRTLTPCGSTSSGWFR